MPGAHKIGAAISGPRIAGGKIMDTRSFLIYLGVKGPQNPKTQIRSPVEITQEVLLVSFGVVGVGVSELGSCLS